MFGDRMLNKLHLNLQSAKNNNLPFGGITILFSGDFMQHPPVLDTPLYKEVKTEKINSVNKELLTKQTNNSTIKLNNSHHSAELTNGRLLWRQLTHCVILTEQMRQSKDLVYAALLSRLRNGNATELTLEQDYKLLCTKIIDTNKNYDISWTKAPICVSRCSLREQFNYEKLNQNIKTEQKPCYLINAIDRATKIDINIEKLFETILLKTESQTKDLMYQLPIVSNEPYLLTKNQLTQFGFVNGTKIKIIGIVTDQDQINIFNTTNTLNIYINMPKYLLIQKFNNNTVDLNNIQFENLPSNVFPLAQQKERFTCEYNHKSIKIERTQFPLTPAFSFTSYKAQGSTFNKIIVDLSKPAKGRLDIFM